MHIYVHIHIDYIYIYTYIVKCVAILFKNGGAGPPSRPRAVGVGQLAGPRIRDLDFVRLLLASSILPACPFFPFNFARCSLLPESARFAVSIPFGPGLPSSAAPAASASFGCLRRKLPLVPTAPAPGSRLRGDAGSAGLPPLPQLRPPPAMGCLRRAADCRLRSPAFIPHPTALLVCLALCQL